MIKRILNIHLLPVKYFPAFLGFILSRMIRKNMEFSYPEWVNFFLLSLMNSNSRYIAEDEKSITFYSNETFYNAIIRKYPSSDMMVYNHIFGEPKEYEIVCDTYNKYFKNETLFIIDAGANVGYASLYFSYKFPKSKIISIEPELSNYKSLLINIAKNKLTNTITPLNKALWFCNTTLSIFTENIREWGFTVSEVNDNNSTVKTETITINDVLKTNRKTIINILKVDIEGAEFELFLDKERHADFIKNTELVAMEIHDKKEKFEKIIANFSDNGFINFTSGELTIFINTNLVNKTIPN